MLLEAIDIRKSFGRVEALKGVSLRLRPASIHAVLGENGAGKSTLMKIFSGVYPASAGMLRVKGEETAWTHAEQARAAGVSTIFQEFILLPNLSVAENLFLGREPRKWHGGIDRRRMERESRTVLESLSLSIDPASVTSRLRVSDQQMVEIAKGVMRDADIFVFDEPTAALGDQEAEQLFRLVRDLKARGKGILYISHRLPELFDLCDEVTVIKDGQFAGHFEMAKTNPDELIATMVGRDLGQLYPQRNGQAATGKPAVELVDVAAEGLSGPVSFSIGSNEIVGLAGLEGQGQIEITRALFEGRALSRGDIRLFGEKASHREPKTGIRSGIGLIPEDRKVDGIYPTLGVDRNIAASLLAGRQLFAAAPVPAKDILAQIASLNIRLGGPSQPIGELSGGNQQKALLARWLLRGVKFLICEEPTRGVDIGAKSEIYALLRNLADGGVPVLVTSRELPELIGLCDRIIVVRNGATVGVFDGRTATEETIMQAAVKGH
ncbi:sugar ABC transporter ATP-binding protein [Ensifer sp. YR511]|uniref:sugar ABC transporter ATP-binding protein n=1 Tax=Ensifer sp. YR511 TaxID=1855294 RepID=UPI00087E161B|nr:sugar ABC transporter ATP-binding protein [Ensifer sp. YR511]SDN35664.1 ribose transport system ATP-binding protein [Ensifer sp. YR511]